MIGQVRDPIFRDLFEWVTIAEGHPRHRRRLPALHWRIKNNSSRCRRSDVNTEVVEAAEAAGVEALAQRGRGVVLEEGQDGVQMAPEPTCVQWVALAQSSSPTLEERRLAAATISRSDAEVVRSRTLTARVAAT